MINLFRCFFAEQQREQRTRRETAPHPDPLPASGEREKIGSLAVRRRGRAQVRGSYSLNCAERQRTAAGTPSAATISRNF